MDMVLVLSSVVCTYKASIARLLGVFEDTEEMTAYVIHKTDSQLPLTVSGCISSGPHINVDVSFTL